jgi:hypothetical protein
MQIVRTQHYMLISLVLLVSVFGGVACGSGTATSSINPCLVHAHGRESKIKPHNSGRTCAEAKVVISLLPNEVGTWPVQSNTPGQSQICRIYPKSALPLEIRCYNHKKYFEVSAIQVEPR